jgi:IS605 OrfB family transposase
MKTWKQNLKHLTAGQYHTLRTMCRLSKNIYNQSIYNIRQHYFAEGTYLRYEANYPFMKNEENYKVLGAAVAQQTMKCADNAFKSFFGLLKLAKSGKYASWQIKMPKYLKKDSMYKICLVQAQTSDGMLLVPMSYQTKKKNYDSIRIKIPPYLHDKKIRQIHIIPKHNGKYFEAVYMFDDAEQETPILDSEKALSIDFGVNNLATCVTNTGESFIVDGKKLKSINQWYNKELSRLSSIKDKQKIKSYTNRQYAITNKRNNRVSNYMYNAAKLIIDYCIKHKIGNIVVGYNDGFQDRSNLGRVNNQNFVQIPLGKLKSRLEYLSKLNGINFVLQEESYTSRASFFDNDDIPVWNPQNPVEAEFSGTRIRRGLYKTKSGTLVNADINGALNILRKSNVVSLTALYTRGEVNTPLRIRVL